MTLFLIPVFRGRGWRSRRFEGGDVRKAQHLSDEGGRGEKKETCFCAFVFNNTSATNCNDEITTVAETEHVKDVSVQARRGQGICDRQYGAVKCQAVSSLPPYCPRKVQRIRSVPRPRKDRQT